MAWKVTYREKDGRRHTRTYEAASRDDLFQLLEKNGIMAIKVEAASTKAKSRAKGRKFAIIGAMKSAAATLLFTKEICDFGEWCRDKFVALEIKKRVALVVASLVGAGGIVYVCATAGDGDDAGVGSGGSGKNSGIQAVTPSVRPKSGKKENPNVGSQGNKGSGNEEELVGGITPPPPPKKDWQALQREAMARKLGRKKEHEIVHNDSNANDGNGRKPIHRNSTEHIMSMVFTTGLGDMPPPLPTVPERDKQRMAQILLDKFEILPNDPDSEEKAAINEVKDALSEHIRNGGDIDDFFSSYHRQLELAHRERMDARKMILDTAKNGETDLAIELLDKFNQNLESKGIKPITLPQWVIEKKASK